MCDAPANGRAALGALILCALVIILSSCAGHPGEIVRDRPTAVSVPVIQPCISGERPAPVRSLKDMITHEAWRALQFQQRVALAARQGLDRQTYGEQLAAVTGACP